MLAFALNDQDGLEFAPGGLSDSDIPCISAPRIHGGIRLWIEIGNPSARKLHKAAKASEIVKIYTYKDPEALLKDIRSNKVHNVEHIEIYSLAHKFLEKLGSTLVRDNKWTLVHTDGSLTLTALDKTEQTELLRHQV
jgi:uncharacterized protein YaeQ